MSSHKSAAFSETLARAQFSANLYGIEIKGSFPVPVNDITTQCPYMHIDSPKSLKDDYSTYDKLKLKERRVTTIQVALVADIVRDGLPIWQNLCTKEVATMMGKSQSAVAQLCESGSIPGVRKLNKGWEINRLEFVRWYMPELFEEQKS